MLYTLIDGNEDMGFKRLDTFDVFPTVIIDMIFMYAYNMTKQDLHHHVILAKSASHRMPVPRAWKRYINPSDRSFRWSLFLENPDTILIDVNAVKYTLSLINWNAVRAKSCPLTQYTRMTTKKAIGVMLNSPISCNNPQTVATAIHMVWHLLTCCDESDFRIEARRHTNYVYYCYVPYFNRPLSAYVLPNKRWTGWDTIAHTFDRFT